MPLICVNFNISLWSSVKMLLCHIFIASYMTWTKRNNTIKKTHSCSSSTRRVECTETFSHPWPITSEYYPKHTYLSQFRSRTATQGNGELSGTIKAIWSFSKVSVGLIGGWQNSQRHMRTGSNHVNKVEGFCYIKYWTMSQCEFCQAQISTLTKVRMEIRHCRCSESMHRAWAIISNQ